MIASMGCRTSAGSGSAAGAMRALLLLSRVMATKLATVLQNVKHAVAPDRIIGPWIALGAPTDGGPRRAWAPRRTARALGAARRAADLPGVANGLRHQPRLAQHPGEGAPAAAHRGPWRRRLFPVGNLPFTACGP